jgi:hypothetical protein
MAQGVGESGQDGPGGEGGEKVAELLIRWRPQAPGERLIYQGTKSPRFTVQQLQSTIHSEENQQTKLRPSN